MKYVESDWQSTIYLQSIPNMTSSEEKYLCISKRYDGRIGCGEQILDKDISHLSLLVEDYYTDEDNTTGIQKHNFL